MHGVGTRLCSTGSICGESIPPRRCSLQMVLCQPHSRPHGLMPHAVIVAFAHVAENVLATTAGSCTGLLVRSRSAKCALNLRTIMKNSVNFTLHYRCTDCAEMRVCLRKCGVGTVGGRAGRQQQHWHPGLARSGVSGPLKTPRSGGFWELRHKTFEPRFGGTKTRVPRVLKSGQETSVSGF